MMQKLSEISIKKQQFTFETYGVRIGISTTEKEVLEYLWEKLPYFLPNGFEVIDNSEAEHIFHLRLKENGEYELQLWQKDKENLIFDESRGDGLVLFENQLHLTIANYAESKIFLHAGVVGWNGKAIVIPGAGFSGKSTLVAELVKLGADYYSDEYAVLDQKGNVHPFPRMLLMRGIESELKQTPVSTESLGGQNGIEPLPVGLILFVEYKANGSWKPKKLSLSEGIMNLVPHTVPIRQQPKNSFEVLKLLAGQSLMVKSKRGEARDAAPLIISYCNKQLK